MQSTNKTKVVSAIAVATALTVGLVGAHSFQPTVKPAPEQPNQKFGTSTTSSLAVSANPIDPKAAKAAEDQANRASSVEKQARQLLKERRFDEAEKACYSALALSPKWHGDPMAATTFQLLGDVRQEQGRYRDALDSYFKARKHSRNLEIDLGIALSYLKLGDLKNAHKFYSEEKVFGRDIPQAKKASYLVQLPGTKTTKAMEASILFARGREKASYANRTEAVLDYQKALLLVPRNGLIASRCAWDLGNLSRGEEAIPYWARAAVFGKGETAHEGRRRLRNVLMSDKFDQALRDAQRIR